MPIYMPHKNISSFTKFFCISGINTQVHHYISSCAPKETGIHTNNFKSVFFVKTGLTTVTVKHRIWDIQQSGAFACAHYLGTHSQNL